MSSERFPAILKPDMTPAQEAFFTAMTSGPRGGLRGPYVALLHSPLLGGYVEQLGKHLRFSSGLETKAVGIAALVAAKRFNCDYIWGAHAPRVLQAGVPDHAIELLKDAAASESSFPTDIAPIVTFCRQLVSDGKVSDKDFAKIEALMGKEGALNLCAACGFYSLLSLIGNLPNPSERAA